MTEPPLDMAAHMAKVLNSDGFVNSRRLQDLLRHIVTESLDDNKPPVKAATIAYDLYGRDVAADRRGESVVRVDVSRLRRKLELYYLTDGADDDVRIEVPKGSYVPIYHQQEKIAVKTGKSTEHATPVDRKYGQLLVILPFTANERSPEATDLVSDLQDDLIVAVTKFPCVQIVLQPSSAAQSAVGSALEANCDAADERYVLEGRVSFEAETIYLSLKLRRHHTSQNVWANRFQRQRRNVDQPDRFFIAGIINELESALQKSAQFHARAKAKTDRDHWDHYFIGLWHRSQRNIASINRAIGCFEIAIAQDDEFTMSHAALAETLKFYTIADVESDVVPFAARALAAGKRAIETGPDNWAAHRALGVAMTMNNQHEAAVEELKIAVEGNPNSAVNYMHLATAEMVNGRIKQAIADFETSLRLDPMDLYRALVSGRLGLCCILDKNYAKAETWAARSLRAPYPLWLSYMVRTAALGHLGDGGCEAARRELEDRQPGITCTKIAERFGSMRPTDIEHIVEGLARAGLPE